MGFEYVFLFLFSFVLYLKIPNSFCYMRLYSEVILKETK